MRPAEPPPATVSLGYSAQPPYNSVKNSFPPTPGACSELAIESVMPSNHLILYLPLLLPPLIFPSIRVFSNESALYIRWPKYCSFSFNISPSNEYSGLISFRIDWLISLQSKILLQHHSSKASALQALRLLYGPTLTLICAYWKNHSLH